MNNLKIIIPPIVLQREIAENVKKSLLIEDESKRLLELAKRAVEVAIERDENAALVMINAEGVI